MAVSSSDQVIVVTGAAGFVGARCVQALGARRVPVVSVDRLDAFDTRPEHAGIDFGTRVGMDDIDAWLGAHGARVRAVIHMGACTDTRETNRAYLNTVNVRVVAAPVAPDHRTGRAVHLRQQCRHVRRRRAGLRG